MAFTIGKQYEIQNVQYNTVVNLYGNHTGSTIQAGNAISLWSRSGSVDQKWIAYQYGSGVRLSSMRNQNFALNRHSGDNSAIAWPYASANNSDTELEFEPYNATQNLYKIRLTRHNYYLTASGATGSLYFRLNNGNNTQVFRLIESSGGSSGGSGLGTSIFNGHLVSHAGKGRCLNVYGNDTISDGRNVCLWSWSDSNAQTWDIRYYENDLKVFSRLSYSTYALNVRRDGTNNCTVFPHIGNDGDSQVTITSAGKDLYYIRMKNSGLALTAIGNSDNANVNWQTYSGAENQKWLFTQTRPGGSTNPDATFYEGHIVSLAGEGHCLNVYGNESISDHRDVNVWSWSSSGAQTWTVADYGSARKVLSGLQYPTYALNVRRDGTNNCTMLTHVGNDGDSLVKVTAVSGKPDVYNIILVSTGLALTVDRPKEIGSNVYWKEYLSSNVNQQWKFTETKTGPITPPVGSFEQDSEHVTYLKEAYSGNYTKDRKAQGGRISEITIHHCAGALSVQTVGEMWRAPGRAASSHYCVCRAEIGQYVMEKDIAWTNSLWESNKRAVTIEVSNSMNGKPWPVDDITFRNTARLIAEIAERNSLGKLVLGKTLTWHSMYAATECPGEYLLGKMGDLCTLANSMIEDVNNKSDYCFPLTISEYRIPYLGEYNAVRETGIHKGVDYTCDEGTPIYAMADGEIVCADIGSDAVYGTDMWTVGNFVTINHDLGTNAPNGKRHLRSFYQHMRDLPLVVRGQQVTKGTLLGYVGNTGYSTGAHLHFGIQEKDTPMNTTKAYRDPNGSWFNPESIYDTSTKPAKPM